VSRILLVEDNDANRKLMGEILEAAGHEVLMAVSGEDAVALATARLPDVVVMDMHMPGLDGFGATRRLRAQASTRSLPVLAVTAMAMRGDGERILAAGCDAYLAKPVSYRDLIAAVAALAAGEPVPAPAEGRP